MPGWMSTRAHRQLALLATCGFMCACPAAQAGVAGPRARARDGAQAQSSLARGYDFLDQMMDRYASGSQLRLVQSFAGGAQRRHFTDSVTYDDALIIDALITRGNPENLTRAELLGDALLYVQEQDPAHDGRIRAAYAPTALAMPADVPGD